MRRDQGRGGGRSRRIVLAVLFLSSVLLAANPRDCLDLSARQDLDVNSPSGVRVTISGYNRCDETLDGGQCRFRVKAIASGGDVIGSQSGRFGGTLASHGSVETKVFVVCDAERVRSVSVEAQ